MGLDTRAFAVATPEWREEWVRKTNEAGERPVLWGLAVKKLTEPVAIEDAPEYHQDGIDELDWPGGLCGGILSGDGGCSSFRGKVYDWYVERVTGHSLYAACDEYWQGDLLRQITEDLERAALNNVVEEDGDYDEITQEEQDALAKWFRVCVENDLVVGGDY